MLAVVDQDVGIGHAANRGVRALFTGVSGTGKTLAAKILAAELGMDLYRVDLAAVINKYIGETEKNLHQVLAYAEALDVILLLIVKAVPAFRGSGLQQIGWITVDQLATLIVILGQEPMGAAMDRGI